MTISNERFVLRYKKGQLIRVITFFPFMILLLTGVLFSDTFLGLNRFLWVSIIAFVYICIVYYYYLKDYNFIHFDDSEEKIKIHYYSLKPLSNERRSIELAKDSIYKIEKIKNKCKVSIIIYQKTPKGVAKYPPISISALNNGEQNKLIETLLDYIKK
jgi:Ca2+/Na+ antiporter